MEIKVHVKAEIKTGTTNNFITVVNISDELISRYVRKYLNRTRPHYINEYKVLGLIPK